MILRIIFILLLLITLDTSAQINNGYYIGYERMCWKNSKGKVECYGKPEKWYHKNNLTMINDSVYIITCPVTISHKDTMLSASDGGFYYYKGYLFKSGSKNFVSLVLIKTDYGAMHCTIDSEGYTIPVCDTFTYQVFKEDSDLIINSVYYKKQNNKMYPFAIEDFQP
jgi:hypothetical protein